MIKLPRLFVNGAFKRIVNPISVSITQNIVPLDIASITLPIGEELPARSWVELFTPYGSAGMFRVRSPHDAYGQDTTTAELEHMISEVGDYIVKEEISEMLPANTAMQRIFKHYGGNKWKLGSVSALGAGKIACEAKYDRVLDSMLAILEQKRDCMMAFDFSTKPWTINIVKKGTTPSAEGRLARNVTSATISCDDTELCTRVWYQTFDKAKKGTWKSRDASTKSKYGIVEGTVRTSSDMTADEIDATVNAYLNDHKEPRVSVNIQAVELAQITGESMDEMTIGKMYRLALPDYGITVSENITSIVWNDIYGNSTSMDINLGAEEDTVVTFLHNLDAKGGGGGGGGKAKDKEEEVWSEYRSYWDKQDDHIAGMVEKIDKQGSILEQAGLTLTSGGLLVYAKGKGTIGSEFEVTKEAIRLKADRVELDAYVKAKDLTADFFYSKIAGMARVTMKSAYATSLTVGGGDISLPNGLKLSSNGVWQLSLTQSGDTYTLTEKKLNGSERQVGTFSRATTLTGAWSGGIYKVTASPQGNTQSSGMLQNGDVSRSGNYIDIKVNAGNEYTGKTLTVNWTDYLNTASMTRHSNASGSTYFTAYYLAPDGSTYVSMGQHYWYHSGSNIGSRSVYY